MKMNDKELAKHNNRRFDFRECSKDENAEEEELLEKILSKIWRRKNSIKNEKTFLKYRREIIFSKINFLNT